MARWLVPLAGERFDLEFFTHWFPSGDVYAIEEDDRFYLAGPHLEELANAEAVYNEAQRILAQYARIILLLEPNMRYPTIDGVVRETAEAKRNHYIFAVGHLVLRVKLHATATIGGTEQQLPKDTMAQDILQRMSASPHLEVAVTLWGKPERSWPQLYRILEEIEQHLGEPVNFAGMCSNNERERFMRTANTAEISGVDARHALGRFDPPRNPMTLEDANGFIRRLLTSALTTGSLESQ